MVGCPVCSQELRLVDLDRHLDEAHPIEEPPPKVNDRTLLYTRLRQPYLERATIIRTKLELRLVKLLVGLQRIMGAENAYSGSGGVFWTWQESKQIKEFEQDVVVWEDENVFERCRFCGQKFSLFLRKHHCRVCGLVTCGDTERECSLEVPASMLALKLTDLQQDFPELSKVQTLHPVRLCTECRVRLLSHRNFVADKSAKSRPAYLQLQQQLYRLQESISAALPTFQESLAGVAQQQSQEAPQTQQRKIATLRKSRQSLLQQFSKYEQIMRKLKSTEVETDAETRIKQAILGKSTQFLETTMVPLQSLPQAMRYNEPQIDKREASVLQNQLVVLEEQKFLLEQQVAEAKHRRHFDALEALEVSLKEISLEAKRLSSDLGQLAPST